MWQVSSDTTEKAATSGGILMLTYEGCAKTGVLYGGVLADTR